MSKIDACCWENFNAADSSMMFSILWQKSLKINFMHDFFVDASSEPSLELFPCRLDYSIHLTATVIASLII